MRTLLLALLGAAAIWYYANEFGLRVGYAPFTPVYYWDYSGELKQTIIATGARAFIAVKIEGKLEEGSIEVTITPSEGRNYMTKKRYMRQFKDDIRVNVEPGAYDVTFNIVGAKGTVRYDWFYARNDF